TPSKRPRAQRGSVFQRWIPLSFKPAYPSSASTQDFFCPPYSPVHIRVRAGYSLPLLFPHPPAAFRSTLRQKAADSLNNLRSPRQINDLPPICKHLSHTT